MCMMRLRGSVIIIFVRKKISCVLMRPFDFNISGKKDFSMYKLLRKDIIRLLFKKNLNLFTLDDGLEDSSIRLHLMIVLFI